MATQSRLWSTPVAILISLAALLAGCTNLGAVQEFAGETSRLAQTARAEFSQLDKMCIQQAELVIVVNNIPGDGPLKDCEEYRAAEGRLAVVTLNVLDGYALALAALADSKSFDLTPDIKEMTGKVHGLKSRSGTALLGDNEASALSSVVDVLVDAAASRRRDAAVQRLVEVGPSLAVTGKVLRSFFAEPTPAPPSRMQPPYANLIAITSSSIASTEAALRSRAMRLAEPIRTSELLRELDKRRVLLSVRTGSTPDKVPVVLAMAIDAWLEALERFSQDALRPDARELRERLSHLREMTSAARDLLGAERN